MLTFDKFIEWGFLGLTSGLLAFAVSFLSKIATSNEKLNSQMEVLKTKFDFHNATIQGLDSRVTNLEKIRGRK